MAKIVAIVNQKGGVGKTTSCVNLAAALKAAGQRILLCDFDPQANATSGMGVDKTVSNGIYDVLINSVETEKAIVHTSYGDVPSGLFEDLRCICERNAEADPAVPSVRRSAHNASCFVCTGFVRVATGSALRSIKTVNGGKGIELQT